MLVYNRLTFADSMRSFFLSSVFPLIEVIFMLMLIHEMDGTLWEKTMLGVSLKSGLVLSLPLSLWALRKKIMLPNMLSMINLVAILALIMSLWTQNPLVFIVLAGVVAFPNDLSHPFLAEFYSRYPSVSRGRRFAFTTVALLAGTVFFSTVFRQVLSIGGEDLLVGYQVIVWIGVAALLVSTFFARALPHLKTKSQALRFNSKELFSILRHDRLFAMVLVSWMFSIVANMWLFPYFTNYLSEETFGFVYDKERVIFLLVILPLTTQLLIVFPMSLLFDKFPFRKLYIFICALFIFQRFLLFFTHDYALIFFSMALMGIGRAGMIICWKLFVNQMVPSAKVSVYMAIHTGLTGIYVMVSPLFGLWALYTLGPAACGAISMGLMLLAILILLPQLKKSASAHRY